MVKVGKIGTGGIVSGRFASKPFGACPVDARHHNLVLCSFFIDQAAVDELRGQPVQQFGV